MLSEGTALPDFTVLDAEGRPVTRDDLLGRWTSLWWFVKADTAG